MSLWVPVSLAKSKFKVPLLDLFTGLKEGVPTEQVYMAHTQYITCTETPFLAPFLKPAHWSVGLTNACSEW